MLYLQCGGGRLFLLEPLLCGGVLRLPGLQLIPHLAQCLTRLRQSLLCQPASNKPVTQCTCTNIHMYMYIYNVQSKSAAMQAQGFVLHHTMCILTRQQTTMHMHVTLYTHNQKLDGVPRTQTSRLLLSYILQQQEPRHCCLYNNM